MSAEHDITENFDDYLSWVAQTDDTELEFVKRSTHADEFNTEPFPQVGIDQLEAAYKFLNADGSFDHEYSVREWAGAKS